MSDKDIFSVSVKLPDDPKEVEQMINLLSQPQRGVMMLMEEPSVNEEMLAALIAVTELANSLDDDIEQIRGSCRSREQVELEDGMPVEIVNARAIIAKAKGLKP